MDVMEDLEEEQEGDKHRAGFTREEKVDEENDDDIELLVQDEEAEEEQAADSDDMEIRDGDHMGMMQQLLVESRRYQGVDIIGELSMANQAVVGAGDDLPSRSYVEVEAFEL